MNEVAIMPRTPTSDPTHNDETSSPGSGAFKNSHVLPTAFATTLTPPPSSQSPKATTSTAKAKFTSRREHSLASPPATLQAGPPISSGALYGEVPSLESVEKMSEEQLRLLVKELLPALGEARVNAAHSKLQHKLLVIEKDEAAKRAEVEHEATRREVQVLQEGSPIHPGSSPVKSPQACMQRNLQLALDHCRVLQHEKSISEKRVKSSKRIIKDLVEENAECRDHIDRLCERIRSNRDHMNDMQASGLISMNGTPTTDYATPLPKGTPQTPATSKSVREIGERVIGSQGPFDALLFAGQVLNGETSSVPASPIQRRAKRSQTNHMRGAHSLSSLPATPSRSRPVTAETVKDTPINRLEGHRDISFASGTQTSSNDKPRPHDDRDSTISASENEDEHFNDNLPGSQASQMATNMLRRSLASPSNIRSATGQSGSPGKVVQSKLLGQVKKPGIAQVGSPAKRGREYDETEKRSKKARLAHPGVGLGIKT